MNDDYLWDRSGPPDPDVARLEHALAPLRYRHRAGLQRPPRTHTWWAAAAAALLCAFATWQVGIRPTPAPSWQIASVEGAAHLGSDNATIAMSLHGGQTLRTGSDALITLQSDEMGQIDLGPDSELRSSTFSQLKLNHGQLHAFIWARPGLFQVDTPSARAIDLGCEYTIHVNPAGDGLLRVSKGWVAFRYRGQESFIPAGAACVTRKRQGPGIPYYEDAPEQVRQGLTAFEADSSAALDGLLAAARPQDGLTLWHLLTRVPAADRGRVYDRLAELVPQLPDVTREGVLRFDPRMIDRCWDALNLENTEWWRGWERKW